MLWTVSKGKHFDPLAQHLAGVNGPTLLALQSLWHLSPCPLNKTAAWDLTVKWPFTDQQDKGVSTN